MMNKISSLLLFLSAVLFIACSANDTPSGPVMDTDQVFTVNTGLDYYKGLTLQVGESGSTVPFGETVVDNTGCAEFNIDLTPYIGKNLWFCVPKMVKFFHTLQAAEATSSRLSLPDKDGGSTLDATGLGNEWIVAL